MFALLRQWTTRLTLAALLATAVGCAKPASPPPRASAQPSAAQCITNPVVATGADPWVILHDGHYYFCQSHAGGVEIAKSDRLADIGKNPWARVWTPPRNTPYSRDLWAPELHYLRGKWYIYVAADDGNNAHHRIYVLEGASQYPQQPFTFKGQLKTPGDRWAIDGTIAQFPGDRLYFIWSGWEGSENVAQNLYIASMSDPCTIRGDRTCISRPRLAWEQHGRPLINEGPEALWHGDDLFIIYSASGAWTDDYCLGQLRWTGGDPMNPESWIKRPQPVFARTDDVLGPGHCCFVKSRDDAEDWIVYHSNKFPSVPWKRQVNMQKFTWNADRSPNFGRPISPGTSVPEPSGDSQFPIKPTSPQPYRTPDIAPASPGDRTRIPDTSSLFVEDWLAAGRACSTAPIREKLRE